MTQTKRKLRKQILSFILCLSMMVSGLPLTAFAETEEGGLCEHHTEHTPECGYVEAVEGSPCLHEHDENCGYIEAVEEVLCDCTETDENGAIIHSGDCGYTAPVEGSPCLHEHDESCGYIAAVEGSACTYECSEETVDNGEDIQNKDTEELDDIEEPEITETETEETEIIEDEEELIENDTEEIFASPSNAEKFKEMQAVLDALPEVSELEGMSDEELSKVHDKAQEAYEVYKSLTEEEQAELSEVVEKLSSIMEWMNTNFIQPVDTDTDMNTSCTEHTYNKNGFCSACDSYQPALKNDEKNYYEISNAGQMFWFAEVFNGNTATYSNVVLTADIDLENRAWTPIGRYSDSEPDSDDNIIYKGTFDGQCHVIRNLTIKVTSTCETGLFSRTEGATLKNFGVISAQVENTQGIYSGVIAGTMKNSAVENVFTAGVVKNGIIEKITITTSNNQAGGIAGKIIKSDLKYSFTTYDTLCGTAEDVETNMVTNCYYLADDEKENSIGENKTEAQFEDGGLAWKLNGDSSEGVWKQTILMEYNKYPSFLGLPVYSEGGGYFNATAISVQISWIKMEFTYTDGEWNPEVHNYVGGGWITSDGADVITVKNTGNLTVEVSFVYKGTKSGISGKFTNDSITLEPIKSGTTTFNLEGKPSEEMDKAELGSITVTVKKIRR